MSERGTETAHRAEPRAPMKGMKMSNTAISPRASVLSQIEFYTDLGYDLEALTVAELLEVQAANYKVWQSSDFRAAELDAARAERAEREAIAKAERAREREARKAAELAALRAKVAKAEALAAKDLDAIAAVEGAES
jgi:hypothetical protein